MGNKYCKSKKHKMCTMKIPLDVFKSIRPTSLFPYFLAIKPRYLGNGIRTAKITTKLGILFN